jgi:FkbM family methyltransferase
VQQMRFGTLDLSVIDPHERDTRYIYDEIFVSQVYYHPEMRMRRHPVIMDVGANIGLYCIWAHRRYQPRAIYCYEASPLTFAYLAANAQRSVDAEITQVKAYNRAIARAPDQTLTLHQSPLVSGISTLLDKNKVGWVAELSASRELVTHEVTTSTVSGEIKANRIGEIDLLKIDVEGYFLEVLAGISDADFGQIRNIVIEIDYAEEVGSSPAAVEAMLRSRGFTTACEDLTLYGWRA